MNVVKANGEIVPFDADKIRRSLIRVKAKPIIIEEVIEAVKQEIYDEIPTSKLYQIVFRKLKTLQRNVAGKYNLKKALMDLGPTGYQFEKFIASVWQAEGFATKTGQIVKGACVSHEVDVVAKRNELHYFVECKHHSFRGKVCSVKNTLYFYARFLDLGKRQLAKSAQSSKKYEGWLVTNTRFTSEAINYGTCVGLGLLSWDFPPKKGLRERIDRAGLHPITCLTSLSNKQKAQLMKKEVTLCRDLGRHPEVLDIIGIRGEKAGQVIDEATAICDMQAKK